ncbi:A/G-specific adenine glycosylase [Buchnera aphidicola]|uniref:A/G-specific adenine glycosylase n=1 Tax=Buchnera aphidicola TaxID=9 RepID=UPI0034638DAE
MNNWKFSQLIINWQHQYGRNNLPWQTKKNPYHIWISEIMLQQTQVKTVIPYFNKFINKFNNIHILSKAKLNDILYLWSGLGYYRRANNLYKTAKIIKNKYQGNFPKNIIQLMQLPGIGKTTAGAILSFSYNFSFPILDGNVKRILIRFYNIIQNQKKSDIEKILWKKITQITPIHHANKFNQGMMDLGSLICTYKEPKCNICPIYQNCNYQLNKKNDNLSIKNNIKKKNMFFIILRFKNLIFLKQRKNQNIWKNLFCFPEFQSEIDINHWIFKKNINNLNYRKIICIHHQFSHLKIKMYFFQLNIKKKHILNTKYNIWYDLDNPKKIGLSKPIKKILLILKNIES